MIGIAKCPLNLLSFLGINKHDCKGAPGSGGQSSFRAIHEGDYELTAESIIMLTGRVERNRYYSFGKVSSLDSDQESAMET